MNCGYENQMKNDPRSYDRNFYNCVKKPFFRLLYAIVKIAITTARIILHLIFISPQFTYDLFHMHHSKERLFTINLQQTRVQKTKKTFSGYYTGDESEIGASSPLKLAASPKLFYYVNHRARNVSQK